MKKKHRRILLLGLVAGLTSASVSLYNRRPRQRVPSLEGLDDPGVAQAFARISSMPQMRLLRWFAAGRATALRATGAAADLGCGTGDLVLELTRRAPSLHVTGIDISEEMLATACARARASGLDRRVEFKLGSVDRITFPDDSLDLVVSTLSLHHWSDPVTVLTEIGRVLGPGGSFFILDLRRDVALPFWLLLWFATRFVVPPALRGANEPLGSRDAAYTPDEAAQLARRAGLRGWRVTQGPLWLTIEGTKP